MTLGGLQHREPIGPSANPHARLPSAPSLLRELDGPADQLARQVARRPNLAQQVLDLAALDGRPAGNVVQALTLLGPESARRRVQTAAVLCALRPDDPELSRWWLRHAGMTAVAAAGLGRRFAPTLEPEESFSSALLHDIGHLVRAHLNPGEMRRVLAVARTEGRTLCEAETRREVAPHTELGALLSMQWALPDSVVHVCMHHEDALEDIVCSTRSRTLVKLVAAASRMADLVLFPAPRATRARLREEVKALLGLDDDAFLGAMSMIYGLRPAAMAYAG
jgi:HD-like signal output (HDOD) protein